MTLYSDIQRAAMSLLAARDHSRQELRRKLDVRGYASADIDAVLERWFNFGPSPLPIVE